MKKLLVRTDSIIIMTRLVSHLTPRHLICLAKDGSKESIAAASDTLISVSLLFLILLSLHSISDLFLQRVECVVVYVFD